jgi:hypothetical protein
MQFHAPTERQRLTNAYMEMHDQVSQEYEMINNFFIGNRISSADEAFLRFIYLHMTATTEQRRDLIRDTIGNNIREFFLRMDADDRQALILVTKAYFHLTHPNRRIGRIPAWTYQ